MIQRVGTGASKEQSEGEEELRQCIFHALMRNAKTVREMHEQDGSGHDDQDADGTDTKEHASENGQTASELRETDKVANDCRSVHESREGDRAGTAENGKENRRAVIQKHHSAGDAQDQEREIVSRRIRHGRRNRVHDHLQE